MKACLYNKMTILICALLCFKVTSLSAQGLLLDSYLSPPAEINAVSIKNKWTTYAPSIPSVDIDLNVNKWRSLDQLKNYDVESSQFIVDEILDGTREYNPNLPLDLKNYLKRSGGDIFGNGGGVVEMRFVEYYKLLPTLIDHCIVMQESCKINMQDKKALIAIAGLLKEKANEKFKFYFIAGSQFPNFFIKLNSTKPLSFKTTPSRAGSIFVNTDHLYAEDKPAMKDSEIITAIIHETGHQIGFKSHDYLNHLGLKVSNFSDKNVEESSFFESNLGTHQIKIYNNAGNLNNSVVHFEVNGNHHDLTKIINSKIKSICPLKSKFISAGFTNPNWSKRPIALDDNILELEDDVYFELWGSITCKEGSNSKSIDLDLKVGLRFVTTIAGNRYLRSYSVDLERK